MYAAAAEQFQVAFAKFVVQGGLLSDELQSNLRGTPQLGGELTIGGTVAVDARALPERTNYSGPDRSTADPSTDQVYVSLHGARMLAAQALGALGTYVPRDSGTNRRGMLYALQGYAEVMLAELFCSGVPLSTYDFDHDFTYRAGSTTEQVYRHAVALFDTALTLGADSAAVVALARVGKGRALLQLGEYAQATATVHAVPTEFVSSIHLWACTLGQGERCEDAGHARGAGFSLPADASVSDREGGVGLAYITGGDRRTASTEIGLTNDGAFLVYLPDKYHQGNAPGNDIVIASGLEARLIEAEALLHTGGGGTSTPDPAPMLALLNALRADSGLAPIEFPVGATPSRRAQEDTLFAERAAWLFVTGHRIGDLRRLVRGVSAGGYGRPRSQVYPGGAYPRIGTYRENIDAPIPPSERLNPLFHGCMNRD